MAPVFKNSVAVAPSLLKYKIIERKNWCKVHLYLTKSVQLTFILDRKIYINRKPHIARRGTDMNAPCMHAVQSFIWNQYSLQSCRPGTSTSQFFAALQTKYIFSLKKTTFSPTCPILQSVFNPIPFMNIIFKPISLNTSKMLRRVETIYMLDSMGNTKGG